MIRSMLRWVIASACIASLVSTPASASTNLFIPISGAAFLDLDGNAVYVGGTIKSTGSFSRIFASLGHANGGSNGFYVYGFTYDANTTCHISAKPVNGGTALQTAEYSPPTRSAFTTFIPTNFASGSYFYSIFCNMGSYDRIFGVKPDH